MKTLFIPYIKSKYNEVNQMNAKLKTDALDLTSLLNGLVFSPQSLYWYEPLQESLSANSSFASNYGYYGPPHRDSSRKADRSHWL